MVYAGCECFSNNLHLPPANSLIVSLLFITHSLLYNTPITTYIYTFSASRMFSCFYNSRKFYTCQALGNIRILTICMLPRITSITLNPQSFISDAFTHRTTYTLNTLSFQSFQTILLTLITQKFTSKIANGDDATWCVKIQASSSTVFPSPISSVT